MKLLKICEWTSSIRFALSEQDLFDWCSATFQKRKAAQIRYDLEFRVYIQGPSKKRNETNHQTIHSGRLKKNLAELLSHTLDYQERGVSKAISPSDPALFVGRVRCKILVIVIIPCQELS